MRALLTSKLSRRDLWSRNQHQTRRNLTHTAEPATKATRRFDGPLELLGIRMQRRTRMRATRQTPLSRSRISCNTCTRRSSKTPKPLLRAQRPHQRQHHLWQHRRRRQHSRQNLHTRPPNVQRQSSTPGRSCKGWTPTWLACKRINGQVTSLPWRSSSSDALRN